MAAVVVHIRDNVLVGRLNLLGGADDAPSVRIIADEESASSTVFLRDASFTIRGASWRGGCIGDPCHNAEDSETYFRFGELRGAPAALDVHKLREPKLSNKGFRVTVLERQKMGLLWEASATVGEL